MTQRIGIEIKNVYGKEMIYPVGKNAQHFADLTGKKTFSHSDLQAIEALGFEIVQTTAPWINRETPTGFDRLERLGSFI